MKLFDLIKTFKNDESGAVTVDWVVLTAALVGLGLAVIVAITPGLEQAAGDINTSLQNANAVEFGAGGGEAPAPAE